MPAPSFNKGRGLYHYNTGAVVPINTVLFEYDLQELIEKDQSLSLQVRSLGTTGVISLQFSNLDDTSYLGNINSVSATSINPTSLISATGIYAFPVVGRYLRVVMTTATTAGSTNLSLSSVPASANRSVWLSGGSTTVSGPTAHDSPIAGSPVRTGARAVSANVTAVANNDTIDSIATLVGASIVKPFSIPEADWQYAAQAGGIVNTTDVVVRAAGAAGIRNYVTAMQIRNVSAVSTEVVIKDGSTVIWRDLFPANNATPREVAFPTPLKGTAATALNVACTTTAAAVFVNAQGYQAP